MESCLSCAPMAVICSEKEEERGKLLQTQVDSFLVEALENPRRRLTVDTPIAMENFLLYWTPVAVILIESELWPNLIISASRKGIALVLLNARMSYKSFRRWSSKISLPLITLMLSKFSLIVALSTVEAIRFQLLNAPPFIIHFAGDLKYAVGDLQLSQKEHKSIACLKLQLNMRPVWMAASIHRGEDEDLITILVTRHPQHGQLLAQVKTLEEKGVPSKQAEKITSHLTKILDDSFENILHIFISNEKEMIEDANLSRFKHYNKRSQKESKNIRVHLKNMRRVLRNDVDLVIARELQHQQVERENLRDELEKRNTEIYGLVKILSREIEACIAEIRKPPFEVVKDYFANLLSVFNQIFSLRR